MIALAKSFFLKLMSPKFLKTSKSLAPNETAFSKSASAPSAFCRLTDDKPRIKYKSAVLAPALMPLLMDSIAPVYSLFVY